MRTVGGNVAIVLQHDRRERRQRGQYDRRRTRGLVLQRAHMNDHIGRVLLQRAGNVDGVVGAELDRVRRHIRRVGQFIPSTNRFVVNLDDRDATIRVKLACLSLR